MAVNILTLLLVLILDVITFLWFRRKMKPLKKVLSFIALIVLCFAITMGVRSLLHHLKQGNNPADGMVTACSILIGVALWREIAWLISKLAKSIFSFTGNRTRYYLGPVPIIHFWMVLVAGVLSQFAVLFELRL